MGKAPVFITGRFRAGTSFLWQLFDRMPGFCAWYEPLHPQLPAHVAHIKPKADHVGVEDYWRSYCEHPEYLKHFNPDFAHNALWLEAGSTYPELRQYIDDLIALSGEQQAVLQFNRMDFRLPWLKANYPDATIIHIKRNPLQLWYSQRKHIGQVDKTDPSITDAYELMQTAVALSSKLPFLARRKHAHAFFRCFVLQRLSDLIGGRCADVSLSLDHDVFESDSFATQLHKHVGLRVEDWLKVRQNKHVSPLIEMNPSEISGLSDIMTAVDLLLEESGLAAFCGLKTIDEIKGLHPEFWQKQHLDMEWHNEEMLHAMAAQQTELTNLMAIKNNLSDQLTALKTEQT